MKETGGIEGQQNFVLSDTNTLVAGLEYRNAKVTHKGLYNSGSYNNKAVFLQDQWKFAPTWQLNTGVRYDDHSKAGSRTTGSVAVNKNSARTAMPTCPGTPYSELRPRMICSGISRAIS